MTTLEERVKSSACWNGQRGCGRGLVRGSGAGIWGQSASAERTRAPPSYRTDKPKWLLVRGALVCELSGAVSGQGTHPLRLERSGAQRCRGRKFASGDVGHRAQGDSSSARDGACVRTSGGALKFPRLLSDANVTFCSGCPIWWHSFKDIQISSESPETGRRI